MDLDHLLVRFFGTADIATLKPAQLQSGVDRLRLQFALERERGRRFAMWSLLFLLGAAPAVDEAFKHAEDREAARDFMDMADREIDAAGDADATPAASVTDHIFGSNDLDDDWSGF